MAMMKNVLAQNNEVMVNLRCRHQSPLVPCCCQKGVQIAERAG